MITLNLFKEKKMPKVIGLAAFILMLPFLIRLVLGNDYGILIACISMVYIIAVSGFDILFGYSGQISLGHAAFFVLGCYVSGLLNLKLGMPQYLTIPIAGIFSSILGGILAYPASKLKFHFLALATISFGEIIYNLLYFSPGGITGNYLGMYASGISFLKNYRQWYYFLLIFVVIALLCKHFLYKSRTGRAFTAIRENTHAADGMGVDVRKYKIIAFMISAFYTGFAGALYVHLIMYIHPDTARIKQSVLFLTMLLFGGTGSIAGPIIGVVVIEVLMEVIRPLQEYQMLVYGILMLTVIVALPGGIYGGFESLIGKWKYKRETK